MDTVDLLTERVERLELSNRRLRHTLYVVALLDAAEGRTSAQSPSAVINLLTDFMGFPVLVDSRVKRGPT